MPNSSSDYNAEQQWATGVIRALGQQPNQRNVSNLIGWAKAEGGHTNGARYNWLNTTQDAPGAGNTGSQGNIKVYRSLQQGIEATAKTLKNGRYGQIISALDSSPDRLAQAIGSSPWGTHNPQLAQIIASGKGSPSGPSSTSSSYATSSPADPSVNSSQSSSLDPATKQQALLSYLDNSHDPNALLSLGSTLQQAGATPTAQTASVGPDTAPRGTLKAPTTGAASALNWANSKIGDPNSRETGVNSGGLASYANKQFGMSNQPWCAMFTSLAVVKGGAPSSARTASVAQVREKAKAKQGYTGFVNPAQAKPGDLVLFGNSHIGMVQRVSNGKIFYVGGNQSNTVSQGETSAGAVDVVRPAYR